MIRYPIRFRVQQISDAEVSTGAPRTLLCEEPGTFTVGKSDESDIVLEGASVSRSHMTLILGEEQIAVQDNDSTNGTFVNGTRIGDAVLEPGDRITIPGWRLEYIAGTEARAPSPGAAPAPAPTPESLSRLVASEARQAPPTQRFPAAYFDGKSEVSLDQIRSSGHPVQEVKFCCVGGGLGSFVFVDHLRCYGVPTSDIAVIGTEPVCYETYKRYCKNSQIPDHERLRSNSLSRPDNIWGFPGYALREAFKGGYVKGIFEVFGEPTLAQSYTPRAGDVFDSLDIEARRIGWDEMFHQGQVRGLRKTTDGRYVIAYQVRTGEAEGAARRRFVIADVVHLSTGYPATRFVDDFRTFIAEHSEMRGLLANAYEPHDEIYTAAENRRDDVFVVVRGRGIVASRIIQRLAEARQRNPNIRILHSMRTPINPQSGARWEWAKRSVINNVEIQPFNWPKSCWGGDLRFVYEQASDEKRGEMLTTLGGTTTAQRNDWIEIAERGAAEGWYRPVYGTISEITPTDQAEDRVRILIRTPDGHNEEIFAHYLIDCTGLIADVRRSPFLADLLDTYHLPRNHAYSVRDGRVEKRGPTGLKATNDFELDALRNGRGRVYAAGTITAGGPYLAVDSFLGLQYSALRSVDHLVTEGIHNVRDLTPLRSFGQWTKWMRGARP